MKTISRERFASLPKGIQESISERTRIKAAITNADTFRKYAKKCLQYHKENPNMRWDEQGLNSLMPYYKALLEVQGLADKYKELWGEKYHKCKLQCEKILGI